MLGCHLPYPVVTRWGTEYKSLSALIKQENKKAGLLNQLLVITQTETRTFATFTEAELSYIKEYIQLTQPLAEGIDMLQGEKESFYGDLLPTLFTIKKKLEEHLNLPTLGRVAQRLLTRLVEFRFKNEFLLNQKAKMAICGAISHPKYKTLWGDVNDIQAAMVVFNQEYENVVHEAASSQSSNDQVAVQRKGFIQLRTTAMPPAFSELNKYLDDTREDLKMLDSYPRIKEMFFKNNTQLPTSAQVERMFNFAGILDHPNRNRILPVNFEYNVVLKANSVFSRDDEHGQEEKN